MDVHQTDPVTEDHLEDPFKEMITEEVSLDVPQEEDYQEEDPLAQQEEDPLVSPGGAPGRGLLDEMNMMEYKVGLGLQVEMVMMEKMAYQAGMAKMEKKVTLDKT